MVVTVSKVLCLIAVIIFGVEFGILLMAEPTGKVLWELLALGLTFGFASFLVP